MTRGVTLQTMHTVVVFEDFDRIAKELMSEDEQRALEDYVSQNPTAGAVVVGTGGVRKLRWSIRRRGKRGGARVITFYPGRDKVFLLDIYDKAVQSTITPIQKQHYRRLTAALKGS